MKSKNYKTNIWIGLNVRIKQEVGKRKTIYNAYHKATQFIFSKPEIDKGTITGGRYLRVGKTKYDPENGITFAPKEYLFVYEIRTSFTAKPIYALPTDIEPLFDPQFYIPFSPSKCQWTEKMREDQRQIMKDVKRDKKGRWL